MHVLMCVHVFFFFNLPDGGPPEGLLGGPPGLEGPIEGRLGPRPAPGLGGPTAGLHSIVRKGKN